jgi:hypothetical protein
VADWRDVMEARRIADASRYNAGEYGGAIEDGRTSDPALAVLLAADAICAELRAFATTLDAALSREGTR